MKKLFVFLTMIVLATSAIAQNYDFSAVCESGQTLYYQISDSSNYEIAVTAPDLSSGYPDWWTTHNKPTGDLIIPDSVEYEGNTYTVVSILERAFIGCSELTSVVIPNSITFIGESAFYGNSALVSAILPNRLTVIESSTFKNCHSLVSITLPDSLTTIKGHAFLSCESLPSITFPNTLLSIATMAFFECTGLSGELVLPSSLQNIGSLCFYGCSGLSGVLTLPESLISMGENCFSQCLGLTGVEFPENLSSIPRYAFCGCTSLSGDLIIPNLCTLIGYEAFANCSNLSSLTIGSSVSNIGCGAFKDCTALETIHCYTPALPYSAPPESDPDEYGNYPVFYHVPTDIPVYVSCLAIDQFQTSVHWSHFTNMQDVFIGAPLLTVEVNNPGFGTAEVVSIPEDCDHPTATVRAIPSLGHVFGYWKRNGAVVSFSPEYTFTLDHNCTMTACFDCSATINDSIGYPDHVIGRKYNAENQVTAEYDSDFSYDGNGMMNRFYFPNPTNNYNSYVSFYEYPSKPLNVRMYEGVDYHYTTETLNFTYEDDHQIKHYDNYRGTDWYDEFDKHYDYSYVNHKLSQWVYSFTTEDGETRISQRIQYSYENGNRTRIDSVYAYSGGTKLSSVITNHYNERQQLLTSQTDTYDNEGTITSSSLKTYTYTYRNKTDSIITQVLNDGEWANSEITHYIYDFRNRVVEYQTGSWSAESSEWNITKKVLYDFNDETQIVTISFRKKNNDEWVWDVFSGQSLFNDSQLNEWQRQLKSYTSYHVNQFEISMHYNTIEQNFPILSEWYYTLEWDNGDITYQHLEYTADTTINEERPKVIVRSNTQYDRDEFTEITHEYILEEGNVVYWWNKDLEEFTTLYDYNAEAGDEWEIKVGMESILVHVDSVGVFNYDGENRKMLHISDASNIFNGDIVVGYGHMTSFFPEKLMQRDAGFTVNGLRCYWVEDALLYHDGDEDCDAIYSEIHGVDEDGPTTDSGTLVVYPNPTNGVLFVETRHGTSLPDPTYQISNLMGQTVLSGSINTDKQQINIANLPKGMYFISVGEQTMKFVVK